MIIFSEVGIEGKYLYFEINKEEIMNLPKKIKTESIKGVNITIPYKEIFLTVLDEINENALNIGAINCINNMNNNLIGYNTDYYGIKKTFEKMGFDVKNKKAVILGSGGAAKAVYQCLKNQGAEEILFATRKNIDGNLSFKDIEGLENKDIIINCTPVGASPKINETLLTEHSFEKFDYAFDLIYNPIETLFLTQAKKKGLVVENGLYMLVSQAIKSEEIWNDIEISEKKYNEIYKKVLEFYN